MSYKLITDKNDVIDDNLTLGKAFTCLDNWCNNNDAIYGLGNIYHEFDNQVGIDVYLKDGTLKQFSIVYE